MDIIYYSISEKTPKIRNLNELITSAITIVVLAGLLVCTRFFSWWEWVGYVVIGLLVLTVLQVFWSLFIETPLFYKTFRYGITDEYLFIKSGVFTITETVVPMTKIQSIELNQGVIMRKFNIVAVNVTTMKDRHSIPYLDKTITKQNDINKHIRKRATKNHRGSISPIYMLAEMLPFLLIIFLSG